LVALLLHILIFLLIYLLSIQLPKQSAHPQKQEKKIKISLKEPPKTNKQSGLTKKKIKPPKIAPPMPKGSQLKKMVQPKKSSKPKKVAHKTQKVKKVQKTQKVHTVQKTRKPTPPPKKPYIPLLEPKKKSPQHTKPKKKDPMAWLYEDKSQQQVKKQTQKASEGGNISQDIRELYGEEFGKLTPGQQKYILDNQEIMRRITQQVLNRVARVNIQRDLRVNTTNIIEFKLHPNGDMTDFRFLKKSGFYVLDDTTKETIEYAYSRYPRPKETTLIRYNVFYNLAY
jgi:outer membrane biosynthesis protein TonB